MFDSSLPSGGWELNLSPTQGDRFLEHVDEIANTLREANASASHSSCGLHCHIGAQDFAWEDIHRLTVVYRAVEDALFGILPENRRSNRYCVPCKSSLRYIQFRNFPRRIRRALYEDRGASAADYDAQRVSKKPYKAMDGRIGKYERVRYSALNLHSFFYRGTIEFRHHHGTVSASEMKNWGLLCAAIVDAAKTWDTKKCNGLHKLSPFDALRILLPRDLLEWFNERVRKYSPEIFAAEVAGANSVAEVPEVEPTVDDSRSDPPRWVDGDDIEDSDDGDEEDHDEYDEYRCDCEPCVASRSADEDDD